MPRASPSGSGSSTNSLGGGSFLISAYGVTPRTSFALRVAGPASARVDVRAHAARTPAATVTATRSRANRFILSHLSKSVLQPTVEVLRFDRGLGRTPPPRQPFERVAVVRLHI